MSHRAGSRFPGSGDTGGYEVHGQSDKERKVKVGFCNVEGGLSQTVTEANPRSYLKTRQSETGLLGKARHGWTRATTSKAGETEQQEMCQSRDWLTSVTGKIINISSFAGHMLSAVTLSNFHYNS